MIMMKPSRMKHYDEASIIVLCIKMHLTEHIQIQWQFTIYDIMWDSSKLLLFLCRLLKYVWWVLIVMMYYKPIQSTTSV